MAAARSRAELLPRARWLAPALLLSTVAGLAPLWWEVTAPPVLTIVRPQRDPAGALLLPAAALRPPGPLPGRLGQLAAAGPATLFVVHDGVARLTQVRLGARNGDSVEVRGGLEESALVVANPPRGLEDRHRVAIRD